MLKRIRIAWLRMQYWRWYAKYHRSFRDNILEAQREHRLPSATIAARGRLNKIVDRLRALDPAGGWKNFS